MDKEKIFCKKALKAEMKKISLEGENGAGGLEIYFNNILDYVE